MSSSVLILYTLLSISPVIANEGIIRPCSTNTNPEDRCLGDCGSIESGGKPCQDFGRVDYQYWPTGYLTDCLIPGGIMGKKPKPGRRRMCASTQIPYNNKEPLRGLDGQWAKYGRGNDAIIFDITRFPAGTLAMPPAHLIEGIILCDNVATSETKNSKYHYACRSKCLEFENDDIEYLDQWCSQQGGPRGGNPVSGFGQYSDHELCNDYNHHDGEDTCTAPLSGKNKCRRVVCKKNMAQFEQFLHFLVYAQERLERHRQMMLYLTQKYYKLNNEILEASQMYLEILQKQARIEKQQNGILKPHNLCMDNVAVDEWLDQYAIVKKRLYDDQEEWDSDYDDNDYNEMYQAYDTFSQTRNDEDDPYYLRMTEMNQLLDEENSKIFAVDLEIIHLMEKKNKEKDGMYNKELDQFKQERKSLEAEIKRDLEQRKGSIKEYQNLRNKNKHIQKLKLKKDKNKHKRRSSITLENVRSSIKNKKGLPSKKELAEFREMYKKELCSGSDTEQEEEHQNDNNGNKKKEKQSQEIKAKQENVLYWIMTPFDKKCSEFKDNHPIMASIITNTELWNVIKSNDRVKEQLLPKVIDLAEAVAKMQDSEKRFVDVFKEDHIVELHDAKGHINPNGDIKSKHLKILRKKHDKMKRNMEYEKKRFEKVSKKENVKIHGLSKAIKQIEEEYKKKKGYDYSTRIIKRKYSTDDELSEPPFFKLLRKSTSESSLKLHHQNSEHLQKKRANSNSKSKLDKQNDDKYVPIDFEITGPKPLMEKQGSSGSEVPARIGYYNDKYNGYNDMDYYPSYYYPSSNDMFGIMEYIILLGFLAVFCPCLGLISYSCGSMGARAILYWFAKNNDHHVSEIEESVDENV